MSRFKRFKPGKTPETPPVIIVEAMTRRVLLRPFKNQRGLITLAKLSDVTGLADHEIAHLVRLTRDFRAAPDRVQHRSLLGFATAWARLRTLFPDDATIRRWLKHGLPRFGGKSPQWLLEEHGLDSLLALIDEMRFGTNG